MVKKMRCLVTGAAGFIGSHLTEALLEKGYQVWAYVRNPRFLEKMEDTQLYTWYGDLTDLDSLKHLLQKKQFDYVFHLAGVTKAQSENIFNEINCIATKNLLMLIEKTQKKIKRFIFFSTLAAIGPGDDNAPIKEDRQPEPIGFYGKSKLQAEKLFADFTIPYTIIRPPAVYGPRERDIYTFFKMANTYRITPILGGGVHVLSMIYVTDLVQGSIQAALSENSIGKAYFLTDGNVYTWQQFAKATEKALDKHLFKITIPVFLIKIVGLIGEFIGKLRGKQGAINKEKVEEMLALNWSCSDDLACKDFNYAPKTKIEKGILLTINWYKKEGWL